ncbi:response regulator transcription factor [Algihabitans albus]|uniref:response regulator transcription factor n=1 Tax=Algihabitans albus TaxID=2164067 RepID=UPI0035D0DE35
MPRVLIVDDHPVVAEGWGRIVRAAGACEVFSAHSPLTGLRAYREERPDLLIVDLSFGCNKFAGVKLIRRLRRHDPEIPVLVFSMHRSAMIARRALEAGSNGFVNKDAPPEEIDQAFRSLSQGECYVSADIATKIALLNRPGSTSAASALTPRELEILGFVAEGKSYREIAQEVCISYKTVTNTCYALRSKLNATNMPELVVKAIEYFDG